VTSELPDHARNAHGNLTLQKRALGPYRGIDMQRYEPGGAKVAAVDAEVASPGHAGIAAQELLTRNACVV
jgi:hypothetical protein